MQIKIIFGLAIVLFLVGGLLFFHNQNVSSDLVIIDKRVKQQNLDVKPECVSFQIDRPCGYITISGTANHRSAIIVALVHEHYTGATDYDAVTRATHTLDNPLAEVNEVTVSSGFWLTKFTDFAGIYKVFVYDNDKHTLLLQDEILVIE